MISVLLVDDHELVRAGIKKIINDTKGMKVVDEVASGENAVKWCRQHHASIILMDIHMVGIGGIEATKRILRYQTDAKIIALTVHTDSSISSQIMQSGAYGYLTKSATPDEMIRTIRFVASGQYYITPEIAQKMALKHTISYRHNPLGQLSDRETQIALMVAKGHKVNEIATILHISPKTVNSYRYRVFNKLAIKNDVELAHLALHYNLITSDMLASSD